ncbi:bactofilin family protein [Candidatus Spongiihabitans sp.]|uniref:bactofilin family protein n=1 Tax=Candidatus Spongiihabitans sp. TaxID=3101308 RepID=UPI003C704BE4
MAIFNKLNQQTDCSSNITTIAAGAHVTGKINVECELHIDGEVDAEINSTGVVKIGQSGVVKSNLRANTLIITGKFLGDAECESIELILGGEVEGKLSASSLTIDASSSFQGESIRRQSGGSSKIVDFSSEVKNSKADEFESPFLADGLDQETK